MPIDLQKALSAEPLVLQSSWSPDDVILYHLSVGAGMEDPTDPRELEYAYERMLKVLPSYAVIPAMKNLARLGKTPGIQFDFARVLHGEQNLEIFQPLPSQAKVVQTSRVAAVYDKGEAALILFDVETRLEGGEKLFANRFSIYARGEGGFGGESGPAATNPAPDRAPDLVVESRTLRQLPLIYRLTGDKHPLHVDPKIAKRGGFDRPILHGLCTYGIVCKAVVDGMLAGDTTRVKGYATRFAGVCFPGETIVTSMWEDAGRILISAKAKERDALVISNAAIQL